MKSKPKISQKFVVEVQAFQFPAYYYVPMDTKYSIQECIARYHLLQIVHGNALKPHLSGHKPVSFSDEAFALLKVHLCGYLGCYIPEVLMGNMQAFGELILDEYKKKVGG